MASNLTRDWIQYLKNNQIAALQSDPKSGKLNYRRPVTASDLVYFLQHSTDYDDKQINQAIDQVVGRRPGEENQGQEQPAGSNVPAVQGQKGTALDTGMTPGTPSPRLPGPQPIQPTRPPSKYAATNKDAEDVQDVSGRQKPALGAARKGLPAPATASEDPQAPAKRTGGKVKGQVSQTPNAIRKRAARSKRGLNEDFKDDPGEDLSEEEVEAVFKILSKGGEAGGKSNGMGGDTQPGSQVDPREVKAQEIEKIKKLIAKTMTPAQRKQLWDALKGAKLSESIIKKYQADEIFKDVINQSKSNYRQSRITMDQLQSAWQKADYPLDTDDIGEMLQGMGYDGQTIERVVSSVVGDDEDEGNSAEARQKSSSQAVDKIAAYIQKAGLTDEITQFMQENFSEDLQDKKSMWQKAKDYGKNLFGKKATTEDVKKIFTLILKEERAALPKIVKTIEHARLGRNKK